MYLWRNKFWSIATKGIATTGTTYNFDSNNGGFNEDSSCKIEINNSTGALPLDGTTAKYCWGYLLRGFQYAFDHGAHAYDDYAKVHRNEIAYISADENAKSISYQRKTDSWNKDTQKCAPYIKYINDPANKDSELSIYSSTVLEPFIVKTLTESNDASYKTGLALQQLAPSNPRKVFTAQEVADYLYVYDYSLNTIQNAPNYTGPTMPFPT